MSKIIRLYYFLSFAATLFYVVASVNNQINDSNIKFNHNKRQDVKDIINEIHNLIVDNIDTYENPEKLEEMVNNDNNDKKNLLKRQNKNEVVENIINEIHNLIVDNVDTYENPKKVEEMINNDENSDKKKLLKRQEEKEEEEKEEKEKEEKKNDVVNDVIKQIHNLIINNKDTYKNQKKLEELAKGKTELRKRKTNNN